MSSSIAIPRRKKKAGEPAYAPATASSSSSSNGGRDFKFGTPESATSRPKTPSTSYALRRPSLMSPAFAKAEHTVINVGDSESPRLITCVKASQGFDWNQEIFLPSYADYHFDDLERKQDPVQDIVLTEEEMANMFPS
ncbi:hypothetical protein P154DRAFT_570633 [Amniculicola lignicola CBS 123094]|uniref:Uncharacterized protein n=1 Tax=Amniculicola lignicola CBS 123094 TaxID=1392246 RepID=A0A6A5WVS3_9PLEO|nr:hypothetical protein P154DRAFT_570633 [Amniculicola lignicola CBS 123094]